MLQFLHQMFNLFALLRDDLLKPATPLTNGAIDETLQQFAPLSDDCLADCRESSTLINHLLKRTPNSAIDWMQVRAVWGPHVRLDEHDVLTRRYVGVCSWQCVTARRPAADIRARCQRYSCRM